MHPPRLTALDDFAGTGWGVACQWLGIEEAGVEIMPEARATRTANGMRTIGADVWAHIKEQRESATPYAYTLYIASPPCQTFSMAGSGSGRKALDEVVGLIDSRAYLNVDKLHAFGEAHDPRTALVLAPLVRIVNDLPIYVVLEQVPPVLPVWQRYADELRKWGYSVWVGILHAEQYGVPQTRKRAVLIARADGVEAAPPTPTHSRYYPTDPPRLDPDVLPWVSMAEALGWDNDEGQPQAMRSNYGTGGDPGARGERAIDEPAATVTSKADRNLWLEQTAHSQQNGVNQRPLTVPANTVASDVGGLKYIGDDEVGERARELYKGVAPRERWRDRPATTIAGDPRVAAPGHHKRQMQDATRVTVEEASILQSYPPGFKWAVELDNGKPVTKTKQFLQIGNAVPPALAAAILSVFLD